MYDLYSIFLNFISLVFFSHSFFFPLSTAPIIAPSNLTLVRTSGTTMAVSWVPLTLEEAQGFVAGYDISYQPSGSVKRQVQTVRAPGDSSEITITGLDPTVGYTAAVAAATTVGSGPVSPPVASPGMTSYKSFLYILQYCCISCTITRNRYI